MKEKEVKELLKKCRHKAEIPITICAILINILAVVLVIYVFNTDSENLFLFELLSNVFNFEEYDIAIALALGKYLLFFIIVFWIIGLIWMLFTNIGIAMVDDIPLTEKVDSRLYGVYLDYCKKLGIKKIPKLFLAPNLDNIYSDGITIKSNKYVRIDNAATDLAIIDNDWTNVEYEIAWELAHIAYGHYSYWLLLLTVIARWLPIIRSLYSRVMCYSADKLASEIVGKENSIKALLMDYFMNKYEEKKVKDYIGYLYSEKQNFIEKLSEMFTNLSKDMPSYKYRLQALLKDEDGKLL